MGIAKEDIKGIVLFTGRTAAGKDSAARIFTNIIRSTQRGVSTTSRPMRSNEIEGLDYYFVSQEDFANKDSLGRFLDATSYNFIYNGELTRQSYGFDIEAHDYKNKIIMASLDLDRALSIKDRLQDRAFIVYVDAPYEIREKRAMERDSNFSRDEWVRRNQEEDSRYKNLDGKVDFILKNHKNFENKDQLLYVLQLIFDITVKL